ncbi:MAG: hypothetical protein Q8S09_06015 [Hyphomonas sp.]|nr:hypothetical protein [Hyphomonas sp.]
MSELKSYLLIFDNSQVSRESVIARIDAMPEIVNWSAFLPTGIAVVSDLDSKELARRVRDDRPSEFRFLLVPLSNATKNGWLPTNVWSFMNRPKRWDE